MIIAPHTMTLDEFLAKYEDSAVLEFADGVVTEKMAPAWNHGILGYFIAKWINDYAHPRELALAIPELRTTDLGTRVSRVPDIAVYVWSRIERDLKAQERGAFVPPDIAIEMASPGQGRREQIERCQQFVALGSRIGLMVDPRTRTIVDVRADRPDRRLRDADIVDLSEVIPGLTASVTELFDSLNVGPS